MTHFGESNQAFRHVLARCQHRPSLPVHVRGKRERENYSDVANP